MHRLVTVFALLWTAGASAGEIDVDPGGWAGPYTLGPYRDLTGPRSVLLTPGEHEVRLGGGTFMIEVDHGDVVHSSLPAATGTRGALTLRTVAVLVGVGDYDGEVGLATVPGRTAGDRVVELVPGLGYGLDLGAPRPVTFRLDDTGRLQSDHPGVTTAGRALELRTVPLHVDPGSYTGGWSVGERAPARIGAESVAVVPGVRLRLRTGAAEGFWVEVDEAGEIQTALEPGASPGTIDAATVDGRTLALRTVALRVESRRDAPPWRWVGATGAAIGAATTTLVPDQALRFEAGHSIAWIRVSADCAVSPGTVIADGERYEISCEPDVSTADAR